MSATINSGKILVVDDEQGFIDVITDVLESEGYSIEGTSDPQQGLKLLKEKSFDLVITDLKMPTVNGVEIVKYAKERNPNTEVIVVTGYGSLETALMALKHGVYDYLLKPFNVADITNTVNNAMEKIRLRQENEILAKRLEKTLNDLSTIYEISRFISSSYDLDEVLRFTADTIAASIGLESLAIFLWDNEKNHFSIRSAHGLHEETKKNFIIERCNGIFGDAFEKEDMAFIDSFSEDSSFQKGVNPEDKKRLSSAVVLPLRADDSTFGAVLIFQVDQERLEDRDKIRLASITMTQVTPIIRFYLYKNEQSMLWSDPLFQIKKQMSAVLEKARLYKGGLVFLIFKLYLKHGWTKTYRILDTYQKVFHKLKSNVTEIDSVIVFGLDSFVVILQGRNQIATEVFASTIKKEIESEIFQKEEANFILDFGYARFPIDGTTAEELIGKSQFNMWCAVKGT